MEKGYNGWTNYETWKVNLEVIDGYDVTDILSDMGADSREELVEGLAAHFEDFVDAIAMPVGINGFAADIVSSFLHKVNFEEIAEHYVDDYLQDNPIEEEVA